MQTMNSNQLPTVALVSNSPERALFWKARMRSLVPSHFRVCTPDGLANLEPNVVVVDGIKVLEHIKVKKAAVLAACETASWETEIQSNDLGGTLYCETLDPKQLSRHLKRLLTKPKLAYFHRRIYNCNELQTLLRRIPENQQNKFGVLRLSLASRDTILPDMKSEFGAAIFRRVCFQQPRTTKIAVLGDNKFNLAVQANCLTDLQEVAETMSRMFNHVPLNMGASFGKVKLDVKISIKMAQTHPMVFTQSRPQEMPQPAATAVLSMLRHRAETQFALAS